MYKTNFAEEIFLKMFAVRARVFGRLAGSLAGQNTSRLVQNAPKLAAVRLIHFVNSAQG